MIGRWPDDKLEREMLADAEHVASRAGEVSAVADLCCHVKAILGRVRELEAALRGEIELCKGDGTDRLLTVLYGESSAKTIGKAIGGSDARMLRDAAEEIERLRRYEQAVQSMADQICSPKTTADEMVGQILGDGGTRKGVRR